MPSPRLPQRTGHQEPRECPQTPVGRLPLAELIASGEDLNQTLNLTPVERVLWDNSARNSEQGSSQESPAPPKSRKRAHSSSPVSSSQKKYKKAVNLQQLQKALKTPQGDPASDLWKKYSLNTYSNETLSPTRFFGQPFSQLLESSSPQTPTSKFLGRDSAGLRRSFSCGNEWPTSAAKRRKIQPCIDDQESLVASAEKEDALQKSQRSKSRLSLLVAKISGDLARPADEDLVNINASSSKWPNHETSEVSAGSSQPLVVHLDEDGGAKEQDESPMSDTTIKTAKDFGNDTTTDDTPLQHRKDNREIDDVSDDFGDDDLDFDMLTAIDGEENHVGSKARIGIAQEGGHSESFLPTTKVADARTIANEQGVSDRHPEVHRSVKSGETRTVMTAMELHCDEFDEDTNDFSAEDLEDAVAMYDETADSQPRQSTILGKFPDADASQKQSTVYGSSLEDPQIASINDGPDIGDGAALSEDEFGGDVEFEEIVAECKKATQGHQSTSQLLSSVCIRHFGSSR